MLTLIPIFLHIGPPSLHLSCFLSSSGHCLDPVPPNSPFQCPDQVCIGQLDDLSKVWIYSHHSPVRTSIHSSLSTGWSSISPADFWEPLCSAQVSFFPSLIPLYYCVCSELYLWHINHSNFPTVTFSFSPYVSSHTGPPTEHSPPLSLCWFLGLTPVHLAQSTDSL